jgi:hypothetical protein
MLREPPTGGIYANRRECLPGAEVCAVETTQGFKVLRAVWTSETMMDRSEYPVESSLDFKGMILLGLINFRE